MSNVLTSAKSKTGYVLIDVEKHRIPLVVVWECDKDGNAANEILEAVETLDVEYMVKKYTEEYGMI